MVLPSLTDFAPAPAGSLSPLRTDDLAHMRAALALAQRGLGNVWPNPAVGCVLVRDGQVVGRGWTQPGGRPHAETQALAQAGEAARGATAYVTLEPCSHHGKTPPCAEALIRHGIARCVCAMVDTDPRVSGRGVAMLRDAGIAVEVGLLEDEARHLNAGFFLRIEEQRPLVTLKVATTLDGKIALANGDSKWITGERARAMAHCLRANHDAILVGRSTVVLDDPELTCRLPGLSRRPIVRVVLDSQALIPRASKLVQTAADVPTWVIHGPQGREAAQALAAETAVETIEVAVTPQGRPDPEAVVSALAERGITRLMIEGGGQVAASFLSACLVDRLAWFRASKVIGGDGLPGVAALGLDRLAASPDFARKTIQALGADHLELYERR